MAYTPGLKVTEATLLRVERRLPLKGEVLVEAQSKVQWDDVVARTYLPGAVEMVNVANKLGLEPREVPECMLRKVGDEVKRGELLARSKGFFGLFKSTLDSPIDGTVEYISDKTGQVTLRAPKTPVEVKAYVEGLVEEVLPQEGVIIKTFGTFIQGIFGIGGETSGELVVVSDDPGRPMDPGDVRPEHEGKVLVGGSLVTNPVIQKALEVGVNGIIAGGIHDRDLRDFLGYDLGVAITGSEDKGLTLILTEGFGPICMAERTFRLLRASQGRRASLNGATQIRAGVMRPEVIIPRLDGDWEASQDGAGAGGVLDLGTPVRLIREPHFGALGKITALPVELTPIPSGSRVRVAEVELEGGLRLVVPRANLEIIES